MSSTTPAKIAFIGAGNMARALIGGLLADGRSADDLTASAPSRDDRETVEREFNVRTTDDNAAAARDADIVVLAVKPQVIDEATESIAGVLDRATLVVSVAAGIPVSRLQHAFGQDQPLVRVMPNTPALFGTGASGLYASSACSPEQRRGAHALFDAVGKTIEIDDESLMDIVTAVSGSGPAYFFALTEALAEAGRNAGLDAGQARELACQTAAGAGVMLAEKDADPGQLRKQVTSPGGTTAAALEALDQADFASIVRTAVDAAVQRGQELGEQ